MEHVSHSLVDRLSTDHLVRQWWEGRWPASGAGFEGPKQPNWTDLDALREASGTGRADRAMLVEGLEAQYQSAGMQRPARLDDLAAPAARTVTTGHQLCLATGPAYTYYKLLTAVVLAERLEARWGTPVIPVFWLASEDHDFEEVSSVWDGAEWHRWTPTASAPGGAVGRMSTEGLSGYIQDWGGQAGIGPELIQRLQSAASGTLSQAMRRWIHHWFGPDRVVVVDGDEPAFKAAFRSPLKAEWTEGVLAREVERVNAHLGETGHAPQVHVRPLNLFHLQAESRVRLVQQEPQGWWAGERHWSDLDAVRHQLDVAPEELSPNALFRPLYQSWLLPDVAVVGGLAEVAYWLQLSTAYGAIGLVQPALVPRDGGWLVTAGQAQEMSRQGIFATDLGQPVEAWEQPWVDRRHPPHAGPLRTALQEALPEVESAFGAVDPSLTGSVRATLAKAEKLLDKLDQQGRRAIRRQGESELNALRALHAGLHPEGTAQERQCNLHALLAAWGSAPGEVQLAMESAFRKGHDGEKWTPRMHVWTESSS